MSSNNLSLRSTLVAPQGKKPFVEVSFVQHPPPKPKVNEVVIRVEASPVNPSDVHILTTEAADLKTGVSGTDSHGNPTFRCEIAENHLNAVKKRIGVQLPVGYEGAGTVVAAGSGPEAQKLLGKVVAAWGLGIGVYSQYLTVPVSSCMELLPGTSPKEAAACFINPLTALGIVETMKDHKAPGLIHTAAASQLGQMLVKICKKDNIPLINIVRRDEQVEVLKKIGAKYIINTSEKDWMNELSNLIYETGIYVAFDATGGGSLPNNILFAMEQAASRDATTYSRYGSMISKVVYVYGFLDTSPIVLNKAYGLTWTVKGWLLSHYLGIFGEARSKTLFERVAKEIKTTFATHYSAEISLQDLTKKEILQKILAQSTSEKFLVLPQTQGKQERQQSKL